MKESEIKALLLRLGLTWESFMQFMVGQTFSSDGEGNHIYYEVDIRRYLSQNGIRVINLKEK